MRLYCSTNVLGIANSEIIHSKEIKYYLDYRLVQKMFLTTTKIFVINSLCMTKVVMHRLSQV